MRTRGLRFSLGVLAVALVIAGLVAACGNKPKTPSCKANSDCKAGQVCVNGQCLQCVEDDACGPGKVCQDGACTTKPECVKDADCSGGQVCQAGKCQACTGDGECGPGGKCNAGACTRPTACTTDEQCADDEDCVDGYCQKPWQGNADPGPCPLATIYFGYDDATIAASERDRLDGNSACIDKTAGKSVYVVGHTDESGTDEYNIALSERRAQTVADYLARLGVDPARLLVVPKGETEASGGGPDKDRRVEFQWR